MNTCPSCQTKVVVFSNRKCPSCGHQWSDEELRAIGSDVADFAPFDTTKPKVSSPMRSEEKKVEHGPMRLRWRIGLAGLAATLIMMFAYWSSIESEKAERAREEAKADERDAENHQQTLESLESSLHLNSSKNATARPRMLPRDLGDELQMYRATLNLFRSARDASISDTEALTAQFMDWAGQALVLKSWFESRNVMEGGPRYSGGRFPHQTSNEPYHKRYEKEIARAKAVISKCEELIALVKAEDRLGSPFFNRGPTYPPAVRKKDFDPDAEFIPRKP